MLFFCSDFGTPRDAAMLGYSLPMKRRNSLGRDIVYTYATREGLVRDVSLTARHKVAALMVVFLLLSNLDIYICVCVCVYLNELDHKSAEKKLLWSYFSLHACGQGLWGSFACGPPPPPPQLSTISQLEVLWCKLRARSLFIQSKNNNQKKKKKKGWHKFSLANWTV